MRQRGVPASRHSPNNPSTGLLDVPMPGIDGFETCRRLRANPATRDIAVVMLTGLVLGFDRDLLSGQAKDFVTKPIGWDLVHRIPLQPAGRPDAPSPGGEPERACATPSAWRASAVGSGGRGRAVRMFRPVCPHVQPVAGRPFPGDALHPCCRLLFPTTVRKSRRLAARPCNRARPPDLRFHSLGSGRRGPVFREELQSHRRPDGQVSKLTVVTQDISVLAAREEKSRFLTYHDQTTETAHPPVFRRSGNPCP